VDKTTHLVSILQLYFMFLSNLFIHQYNHRIARN
jgi:hypothetical protein